MKPHWKLKAGFIQKREDEETRWQKVAFKDPLVVKRPRKDEVGEVSEQTEPPKGNDTSETTPQQKEEGVTPTPEGEGTSSQPLQQNDEPTRAKNMLR